MSDTAQPRDAGGLPRGANASRDRIVRAVIIGIKIRSEGWEGRNGQGKHREQRRPK